MRVFSLGRRPLWPFVLHYSPDSGTLAATARAADYRRRDVWQWNFAGGTEWQSEQRYSYRDWDSTVLTFDGLVFGTKANLPTFRLPTKPGTSGERFRYCKALVGPVYATLARYNGVPTNTSRRGFLFAALVRDASNPRRRRTIEWVADSYLVGLLGLSADGGQMAAQVGYALRVWDTTTGEQLGEVRARQQQPKALAFSADGRYLAVCYRDFVTFFDTANWTEVKAYSWNIGKLRCLAFSPDGTTAAVGSDKGKVVVFDLD